MSVWLSGSSAAPWIAVSEPPLAVRLLCDLWGAWLLLGSSVHPSPPDSISRWDTGTLQRPWQHSLPPSRSTGILMQPQLCPDPSLGSLHKLLAKTGYKTRHPQQPPALRMDQKQGKTSLTNTTKSKRNVMLAFQETAGNDMDDICESQDLILLNYQKP